MNDMRSRGKFIWIFFYIAFIPILAIRYSAVALGASMKGFFDVALPISEAGEFRSPIKDFDLFYYFSIFGYLMLAALVWPLVYVLIMAVVFFFWMYKYCVMVGSLNRFKKLY